MIDPIVQEVREIRAKIAADFGYDRARFWAWARNEQEARRESTLELQAIPNKTEPAGSQKPHPSASGKNRRIMLGIPD